MTQTAAVAEVPHEIRARLALALDVDDLVVALRLARQVGLWFGVAKVGLELFTAAGPDAVSSLTESGFDVFVDLNLFFFQAEDGIRDYKVTGVQTCALPI